MGARLRKGARGKGGKPSWTVFQPDFESVRLEGEFPNTKLVVAYLGRVSRKRYVKSVSLWSSVFASKRGLLTPYQVALIIHSDIIGSSA